MTAAFIVFHKPTIKFGVFCRDSLTFRNNLLLDINYLSLMVEYVLKNSYMDFTYTKKSF